MYTSPAVQERAPDASEADLIHPNAIAADSSLRQYYDIWNGAHEPDELLEFAANPQTSASLLVRAAAFERAMTTGWPGDSNQFMQQYADLSQHTRLRAATAKTPYPSGGSLEELKITDACYRLALLEGFDSTKVFPDPKDMSWDHIDMQIDTMPAHIFIVLDSVAEALHTGQRLPTNGMSKVLPLALDINNQLNYADIPFEAEQELRAVGELSRLLEYGDDHGGVIDNMLEINPAEARQYAKEIYDLYMAAEGVPHVYPARYRQGIAHGIRELVASSLYAVRAHMAAGNRTDANLPLNGNKHTLQLELGDQEPHELINYLHIALERIAATGSTSAATIPAVRADGYSIFRFIGDHRSVACYIRPLASHTYNPTTEYGRLGTGVEASIGYIVDPTLSAGALLEVGKHQDKTTADNRVSVRLDREDGVAARDGRRDPTRIEGKLSLDVGSVLGKESWLGTKIGRFLAHGNRLRMEQLGQDTTLNHVAHYFSQDDGRADVFAAQADAMRAMFQSKSLTAEQLRARYVGLERIVRL